MAVAAVAAAAADTRRPGRSHSQTGVVFKRQPASTPAAAAAAPTPARLLMQLQSGAGCVSLRAGVTRLAKRRVLIRAHFGIRGS